MSEFDVVAHLKSNPYRDDEVTEAPAWLTVEHEADVEEFYILSPLNDESSLLWVKLVSDTFNELIPGYSWCVDDPGTLYAQTDLEGNLLGGDPGEPLVALEVLQPVADEALRRYRLVVEHLRSEGREVYRELR